MKLSIYVTPPHPAPFFSKPKLVTVNLHGGELTWASTVADIKWECEEEGGNSCVDITSSDKRDNILITQQPRWFYYMAKER